MRLINIIVALWAFFVEAYGFPTCILMQKVEIMARTLQNDEDPTHHPKYKVGDEVIYINDYCVNWGKAVIMDIDLEYKFGPMYTIEIAGRGKSSFVGENNLHIPGTEPTFDLELNNGMVLTLVSTDDNANRYYKINDKRVVLIDGELHCVGGDWDDPGFPIDEQYQPKK